MIIDRDLHLVRMTGARYHAAHISTRDAVDSIRRAKDEGLAVTADTAPPYFMLNELSVSTYDTAFKLAPPLRSEDDREAIIEGIADGTIDAIASDHIAVDGDAKAQPFGRPSLARRESTRFWHSPCRLSTASGSACSAPWNA